MNAAFSEFDRIIEVSDYNISLGYNVTRNEQYSDIEKVTKLDNINNYTVSRSLNLFLENPKYNEEYLKLMNITENEQIENYVINAIGEEQYKKYLKEYRVKKTGIMHCYSGTPEMSKNFIDIGYYLGVGGSVTRYKDIQETVKITPIDKIVIETDSPVLPPEPFEKHSRNNSLYLNYIVKKISELKGLSEEDVIKYTTQNAYRVYGIKDYFDK